MPGATRYAVYRAEGVTGLQRRQGQGGRNHRNQLHRRGPPERLHLPLHGAADRHGRQLLRPDEHVSAACCPCPVPTSAFEDDSPLQFTTGDGDAFLDNCEVASVRVTLENTGAAPLTNVRIVSVAPVGNPVDFLTPFPVSVACALSSCEVASASFGFRPQDMSFDGTAELLVTFTADEISRGADRAPPVRARGERLRAAGEPDVHVRDRPGRLAGRGRDLVASQRRGWRRRHVLLRPVLAEPGRAVRPHPVAPRAPRRRLDAVAFDALPDRAAVGPANTTTGPTSAS